MKIDYSNLVNNYLRVNIYENGSWKYGIVDAYNGKEYVQAVFDSIQFHEKVNMFELTSNGYKALWKLSDFENYAKSL